MLSYISVSKIDMANFKIKNIEQYKRKLIHNSIGVDFKKTFKLENDYKKIYEKKDINIYWYFIL